MSSFEIFAIVLVAIFYVVSMIILFCVWSDKNVIKSIQNKIDDIKLGIRIKKMLDFEISCLKRSEQNLLKLNYDTTRERLELLDKIYLFECIKKKI